MSNLFTPEPYQIHFSEKDLKFAFIPRSVKMDEAVDLAYLGKLYQEREPITALVLYDKQGAKLARQNGIEIVLASYGNGTPTGIPDEQTATLSDIVRAIKEIKSENNFSFLVADIPLLCYPKEDDLLKVAKALIAAGADAIKIEGGAEIEHKVSELTLAGIHVIGHIGYMPKTGMPMGLRGNSLEDVHLLHRDAMALINAGAKAIVMELIRGDVAAFLTRRIPIPTVGIYSGPGTSGQVLVLNDILEVTHFDPVCFPKGKPKSLGKWEGPPHQRLRQYYDEVKSGEFPFSLDYAKAKITTIEEMWAPSGAAHYK